MSDRPPHHLVVTGDEEHGYHYAMECPHAASDEGPKARWGDCAYLEPCGCNELYRREAAFLATVLRGINSTRTELLGQFDTEDDDVLELDDYLAGCFIPLDLHVRHRTAGLDSKLRIAVEPHDECPATGLEHQVWEGDICTMTGDCGYIGDFEMIGTDLIDHLLPLQAGRYPLSVVSWGEDGLEVALRD